MSIFAVEKLEAVRENGKIRFFKLFKDGIVMITNDELLTTTEYWTTRIQLDLYSHLQAYMKRNGLNKTQLAQKLGVTKSYVTQILNGDFDHRISKLVELSLAVGLIPRMEFVPKTDFFEEKNKVASGFHQVPTNADRKVPLDYDQSYQIQQRVSQLLYATSNNNDDQYRFAS